MLCLFVFVSLTSSIIGEDTVLCYEGTVYRTVQNCNDTCSSLPLKQVPCVACFIRGNTQEPTGDEKFLVEFGCELEGMVDKRETAKEGVELTVICDTDLCNCHD